MGLIILTLLGLKYLPGWVKLVWLFHPDKKQETSKEKVVAVAEEHKTQVAVNNHGKTNEATKDVKEPLKTGQTQPTAAQKQKQDENKQKKSRGRKM